MNGFWFLMKIDPPYAVLPEVSLFTHAAVVILGYKEN